MLYSEFRLRGPFLDVPEWRNWQTRGTQNPVGFTPRVGSIPSSGTTTKALSAMRPLPLQAPNQADCGCFVATTSSGRFQVNWRQRQYPTRTWLCLRRQSSGAASSHLPEPQPTQSIAAVAGTAYIARHRGISSATRTFYADLNGRFSSIPLKEVRRDQIERGI